MLVYVVLGIIGLLTLGYFLLMFFYPEWVGISGEDTKKTLESHKEEQVQKNQSTDQKRP